MIQKLEKIKERIMKHQQVNGFETIFDFINEDLDEIISSQKKDSEFIEEIDLSERQKSTDHSESAEQKAVKYVIDEMFAILKGEYGLKINDVFIDKAFEEVSENVFS